MLRITHKLIDGTPIIRLEGKLLQPWVEEVREQVRSAGAHGHAANLDLASVTYADASGVELLRELRSAGARIDRCSTYIAELLELEIKR